MKMTTAKAQQIDKMTMKQFAGLPRTVRRDYLRLPMAPERIGAIMRKLTERSAH